MSSDPDPLRARPPERALRWAAAAIGRGSRIASVRRLTAGGWHANHALTIVDRGGTAHRVVLRRWARPEWVVEDPEFTAAHEAAVLELLARTTIPVPRVVAADPDGAASGVPALLITRLPGRPPGLPRDMAAFLEQLARALPAIHAVDRGEELPPYRRYYGLGSRTPPAWSRRPELWQRALELAREDPPSGLRCFIHRDYHPENTLWSRGRLTGIVDWTSACWGPPAVDTGHMRWNLAVTYGLDAADEFLRLVPERFEDQPYWDLVTVLDLGTGLDPRQWPRFDLERFERYVGGVLERW
jgi:aminoglycoside phosphotransferase (APT) family kinase protein